MRFGNGNDCLDAHHQNSRHTQRGHSFVRTDAELVAHIQAGAADLWKALVGVNEDHFFTLSTSSSVVASQTTLSGVPSDLYRVKIIEPTTLSSYVNTFFRPKDYASAEFRRARSMDAQDPQGQVFFYDLTHNVPEDKIEQMKNRFEIKL